MHFLVACFVVKRRAGRPRWATGGMLAAVGALLGACAAGPAASRAEPTRLLRAEVAVERGEYAFAASQYRAAAAASRDPLVAERAARIAFDYGQTRELERIAREWLARDPASETARRFLAVALLQLDQPDAAAREFAALIKTGYPTPGAGFIALQESLGELDAAAAAARMLADLARSYPETPEAHYAEASLQLEAANSSAALAAIERALALKPGWREAEWLQARALVISGDCNRGLTASAALAAEAPDGDRLMHAWLLSVCERNSEAAAVFVDVARGGHFRAEALEALGGLALDGSRYDEATKHYTEALAAGRETDRAVYGLAVVADRRGDREHAVRLYSQVTTGPRATAAQLRAYRLRLDLGDRDGAARALDDYVVAAPDKLAITTSRAQLLADAERGPEGLALLQRAMVVYPDQEDLHLARATVLERMGRADAAVQELSASLARRPNDAVVANALGYTLADHGLSLARAEALIRRAIAERPDSAAIQDSLGWVLYRRGRATEALPWLQRAYGRDPDPEVAAHLGEVQWECGDRDGAVHTWRTALERAPGNRDLIAALGRRGVPPAAQESPPAP
jgi:tetratricopeptide (TPR) repeat protein